MLLSELQNKTLISITDGKNIGNIVDIEIDAETGKIVALTIEYNRKGFAFSNKNNSSQIKWENIKKIGEDVILININ